MTTADTFGEAFASEPESIWEWIAEKAKGLGRGLLEKALVAYYVAMDEKTPLWARTSLLGALVYLGFPVDAVPDITPFVGYADDAAVLGLALAGAAVSIRLRHLRQARAAMKGWGISVDMPEGDDDEGIDLL